MAGSRWLFWIIVAAFLWLMVGHLTEIEKATLPLIQGQPEWMLLAAVLQVLYYAAFAECQLVSDEDDEYYFKGSFTGNLHFICIIIMGNRLLCPTKFLFCHGNRGAKWESQYQ